MHALSESHTYATYAWQESYVRPCSLLQRATLACECSLGRKGAWKPLASATPAHLAPETKMT